MTVCQDPTGRIRNWDQRVNVAPDGRLVSFTWTYDSDTVSYRDIHRRISADEGLTWTDPEPLGITDQAGHPAILPDGRVVLRLGGPLRDAFAAGPAGCRDRRR